MMMRHTVRFTGFIISAIVVLMVVSTPHLVHAAVGNPQAYHLKFHRPMREGFRFETTGQFRSVNDVKGTADGQNAGDMDEFLEAKWDVVEKIVKVDSLGRSLVERVYFKSLKFRSAAKDGFDIAECSGKPLTIVTSPDLSITRDDGEDIIPDEMEVLSEIYHKLDVDEPVDDELLGPGHEVTIGDSWNPDSVKVAKLMQSSGMLVPDKGVNVTVKIAAVKHVSDEDCLVVDMAVDCPNVDGMSNLPDAFRSVHGNFKQSVEWLIPTSPEAQQMSFTESDASDYTSIIEKDGGLPVTVKGKRTLVHSENFVKEL